MKDTEALNKNSYARSRFIAWAAWSAVLFASLFLTSNVLNRLDHPGSDFTSYYTAGHLVLAGEPVYLFYDDDWFRAELHKIRPDLNDIYNANLPTTAIASVPIALLGTENQARTIWLVINVIALIYVMLVTAKIANLGPVARPLWYAAIIAAQPVSENFILGQFYIVVTACLLWIYQCLKNEDEKSAGIILASLLMIKTAGTMLWPYFVIQRRWKLLLIATLVVALVLVVTFPLIGTQGWQAYFDRTALMATSPYQSVTAYQSVIGWFLHMFSPHPMMQTEPIVVLPLSLTNYMAFSVIFALLAASFWITYKSPNCTNLHYAVFILLIPICVPVSLVHAYVMTLIPIALLLKSVSETLFKREGLLVLIGATMILLPLPFRSQRLADGYLSLLAYPKLYGALLLWFIAVWLIWNSVNQDHSPVKN